MVAHNWRNFEGALGSMSVIIMSGYSFLADTTSLEERALRLIIKEILMLLPTAVSLIGVGFLIENLGYVWPGVIVLGGTVPNGIYVALFVPATFEPMKNAKFFDTQHIKRAIKLFTTDDGSNRKWRLIFGGSRGRARRTPPMGPNSFVFAYIFTKKHRVGRCTPPNGCTPPYGKSWIRHC